MSQGAESKAQGNLVGGTMSGGAEPQRVRPRSALGRRAKCGGGALAEARSVKTGCEGRDQMLMKGRAKNWDWVRARGVVRGSPYSFSQVGSWQGVSLKK
jgi:hypothetical protein